MKILPDGHPENEHLTWPDQVEGGVECITSGAKVASCTCKWQHLLDSHSERDTSEALNHSQLWGNYVPETPIEAVLIFLSTPKDVQDLCLSPKAFTFEP